MTVTCGILVHHNGYFLVCHPTNAKWKQSWSLPKGIQEPNESAKETALRELREETNLNLSGYKLKDLGIFDYRADKKFHVFSCEVDKPINPKTLSCSSTFSLLDAETKEVDSYAWIPFEKAQAYLNPNTFKVWKQLNLGE